MELKYKQDNLVLVGDIHGEFRQLSHEILHKAQLEDTLIICLGDIGMGYYKMGYYKDEFQRMSKKLAEGGNELLLYRGNHDDPSYFHDHHIMNWECGNIQLLSDYTVISQGDRKMLIVGGGLSVDRSNRKEMNSRVTRRDKNKNPGGYWEDELIKFTTQDEAEVRSLSGITTLLTHMAPHIGWPFVKYGIDDWLRADPGLIEDDAHQRKLLTEIYEILKEDNPIQEWYYGHYHEYNKDYQDDMMYQCCASNTLYELRDL